MIVSNFATKAVKYRVCRPEFRKLIVILQKKIAIICALVYRFYRNASSIKHSPVSTETPTRLKVLDGL